ncbi:hypothetical protein BC567DRAFT_221106 [Phyllosticta citribraziliensis]
MLDADVACSCRGHAVAPSVAYNLRLHALAAEGLHNGTPSRPACRGKWQNNGLRKNVGQTRWFFKDSAFNRAPCNCRGDCRCHGEELAMGTMGRDDVSQERYYAPPRWSPKIYV